MENSGLSKDKGISVLSEKSRATWVVDPLLDTVRESLPQPLNRPVNVPEENEFGRPMGIENFLQPP